MLRHIKRIIGIALFSQGLLYASQSVSLPPVGTCTHLSGAVDGMGKEVSYSFRTADTTGIEVGLLSEQSGQKVSLYRVENGSRLPVAWEKSDAPEFPVGVAQLAQVDSVAPGEYALVVDGSAGEYVCTLGAISPKAGAAQTLLPASPSQSKTAAAPPSETDIFSSPSNISNKKKDDKGLALIWWIVIGLGCAFLLIVVVVVCICVCRRKPNVQLPQVPTTVADPMELESRASAGEDDISPLETAPKFETQEQYAAVKNEALLPNADTADYIIDVSGLPGGKRESFYLSCRKLANASPLTIGRAESSDIRLNDKKVSLHHCELFMKGNKLMLIDKGSKNGTRINKHHIAAHTSIALQRNDAVTVGQVTLTFIKK